MAERATAEQSRANVLQAAFDKVLPETPDTRIIAFGSDPLILDRGAKLPTPAGGTALTEAIEAAAAFHPQLLLVLSDGEPNSPDTALEAARRLSCRIVTIFCGSPADHAAALFMQRLGWCSADGLGEHMLADLRQPRRLEGELRRLLLGGPAA
jgi:hypothetical protein